MNQLELGKQSMEVIKRIEKSSNKQEQLEYIKKLYVESEYMDEVYELVLLNYGIKVSKPTPILPSTSGIPKQGETKQGETKQGKCKRNRSRSAYTQKRINISKTDSDFINNILTRYYYNELEEIKEGKGEYRYNKIPTCCFEDDRLDSKLIHIIGLFMNNCANGTPTTSVSNATIAAALGYKNPYHCNIHIYIDKLVDLHVIKRIDNGIGTPLTTVLTFTDYVKGYCDYIYHRRNQRLQSA